METRFVQLQGDEHDAAVFAEAGRIIRAGGLVAFPTETVYGLGGNGLDPEASRKIYAAKGRPSDNPLILHIAERDELPPLVQEVPETAGKLMDAFWPGPLTLIFRKRPLVPKETTGGLDTVAVRMPSHPGAAAFIRAAGVPIAAPSANLSGRPSPTTAEHVREDLNGRIDMILDGGESEIGLESTIVDVTGGTPTVLRPGYIGRERLEALLGEIRIDPAVLEKPSADLRPKAPGMKYRHYAPKAPLTLVKGEAAAVSAYITEQCLTAPGRAGILCSLESACGYAAACGKAGKPILLYPLGEQDDEEAAAHRLFAALRQADEDGAAVLFAEACEEKDLGAAIMNRLKKAAAYHIIEV